MQRATAKTGLLTGGGLLFLLLLAGSGRGRERALAKGARTKPFAGKPSKDVLTWLPEVRKAVAAVNPRLPVSLVLAVLHRESGGDEKAVSPGNAKGLMQILPGTFRDMERQLKRDLDPFRGEDSILAGVRYLANHFAEFGDDTEMVALAYHDGQGAARIFLKNGRRPTTYTNKKGKVVPVPLPNVAELYIPDVVSLRSSYAKFDDPSVSA